MGKEYWTLGADKAWRRTVGNYDGVVVTSFGKLALAFIVAVGGMQPRTRKTFSGEGSVKAAQEWCDQVLAELAKAKEGK